jgi:transcriptional regulator with XRE-family HTH domain
MTGFAKLIYELRKEKGWTQAELGEQLNLTDKAISRWETGESLPETQQLVPLSLLFNITIDELLKGERRADIIDKNIASVIIEEKHDSTNKIRKIDRLKNVIFNKKFLLITVPILIVIIISISFLAVYRNNYNAILEQTSEVYADNTLEEIDGEYEVITFNTYKELKSSALANKVIHNNPLKERYNLYYFMNFVLLVIKFNDLVGYDYFINDIGFNNTDVTVKLVGSRCAESFSENPGIIQTYYCFICLPKKTKYPEEIEIKLSEMNVNFSIEERFDSIKKLGYQYVSPDQSNPFDVYYSNRKNYELYRATSKEGMDEYRAIDEGMNYTTLIGNMIYRVYYNDEFFEDNDLFFIQINAESHTSVALNIIDGKVNIREYVPGYYSALCEDMESSLSLIAVPKGTEISSMEVIIYRTIYINGSMPWFNSGGPPIILPRTLVVTELSDNLTYYR